MTKSWIVSPLCSVLLLCGTAIAQTNGSTASNNGASANASNGAQATRTNPSAGTTPDPNGPYAQESSGPNTPPSDGPGATPKSASNPSQQSAHPNKRLSSAADDPNYRNGNASQPGANGRSGTHGTYNASPPGDTSYPSESNPNGNIPNAKPGTPVGPVPPGAADRPNSVNSTNPGAGSRTKAADGVPSNRGNNVLSPKKDEGTASKADGSGGNPAGTAGGR